MRITIHLWSEGWAGGWSTCIRRIGIEIQKQYSNYRFIGLERSRTRTEGDPCYRPDDSCLGPPCWRFLAR